MKIQGGAVLPAPPPWSRDLLTVGVTGTNGKTSTTRWVGAMLARLARPVAQVTTVGAFLDDEPFHADKTWEGFLGAMRAGIARGGKLAAIELTSEALARGFVRAWPCKIGVFTNLTHDHLDAHGTPEHYLASKAQLFLHLPPGGVAVLNGCDEASELIAEVVPGHARVVRYGTRTRGEPSAPLDLEATSIETTWKGTRVALASSDALPGVPEEITLRAIGSIYAENALGALGAAIAAGVPGEAAAAALAEAAVPPGRFEVVHERPWVVVDYAHTPDALRRTLLVARALCRGDLAVVFGAGGDRDAQKRGPMGKAASLADRVILTSDNPRTEDPLAIARAIRAGVEEGVRVEVEIDRRRAIERAVRDAGADDVVVLAGKGHESEQITGRETRPFDDAKVARAVAGRG
jgi:UDP-N-acetylmuramoyl-L-alanyl-D-glutamate--2,6-diaminopimelate ligase